MSTIPEARRSPDGFNQTPHAYAIQAVDRRIEALRAQQVEYMARKDRAAEKMREADEAWKWAEFEVQEAQRSKDALIAHRNGVLG